MTCLLWKRSLPLLLHKSKCPSTRTMILSEDTTSNSMKDAEMEEQCVSGGGKKTEKKKANRKKTGGCLYLMLFRDAETNQCMNSKA